MYRVVEEFHSNGVFPRGGNTSFMVRIPKVENPQHLNHFRPISLIECCYKIIAKILAKCLREVLPLLIDESQSTFLGERNILDSVLIANEVVDEAKKRKAQCFLFKADFEKAYDTVRWKFLYSLIRIMGFPDLWVRWIKECLESASVSVVVNDSQTKKFNMKRGLRKGDLLAPFLFLVVAKSLAALMIIGNQGLAISSLQFVDDTLFLGMPLYKIF